ncbi:MAG: IgGFc-binding protein [Pseudomonadota bacterium]
MRRTSIFISCVSILCACNDDFTAPQKDAGIGISDGLPTKCSPGESRCNGNVHQACKDGYFQDVETCESPLICAVTLGDCAECDPATGTCIGNDVHECTAEGKIGGKIKTCPEEKCENGQCTDRCSIAAANRSYIGCDYWPTVTANSALGKDFSFAVVVSNPQTEDAIVNISSIGNPTIATETVPANSVSTIKLPWVDDLKQNFRQEKSVLVPGGAYHLQSSLPVTVYQFSPLNYMWNFDCTNEAQDPVPGDGKCYSYSNDASLLIPQGTLTQKYMVASWPTMMVYRNENYMRSPGFFAVVATQTGDTKVDVTFSANTQSGTGDLAAFKKGDKTSFTLPQGSVLQIFSEMPSSCEAKTKDANGEYCDLREDNDLTGTQIESDKPIAVFAGHNCTFIPFDKWACDHIEEQMFPIEAWGKHYIGTHTLSSGTDPCIYRVLSAEDNNEIAFDPPVSTTTTLKAGEYVEFVTTDDFEVTGSGRIMLVQYMVGQNYSTPAGAGDPGDPAMALAVPVEQYRTTYQFLSPGSYDQNYVNVILPLNATATLDGEPVVKIDAIGSSGFGVSKVEIGGGNHVVESSMSVGISAYGVGSYTSYMYPGGLDLKILK